ncbi:MAG: phosphotriesterase [Oscillospiraceae bacterium]|nr:phosphotriesterase [Oscillospiraceae bacterium]
MGRVVTVQGALAPETLGFCHSHEHLWINPGRSAHVNPALRIDDEEKSLAELIDFRQAGGRAVVDAQPVGCGRNAPALGRLSARSGVHIVAATGFHKMCFYPKEHWVFSWDEAQLTALYAHELRFGMYADGDASPPALRCGHRAGVIKTALDTAWTAQTRKLFAAAGAAARETGAPLMVHVERGSDPEGLADFWEARGVDPARMIFCHMDRAVDDPAVHRRLCRRGAAMEYDTVARGKYHSDAREAEIVAGMTAAGFGGQILMGLDVTRARMVRYGGTVGLPYILKTFLPLLHRAGVPAETAARFFTENPARLLQTHTPGP